VSIQEKVGEVLRTLAPLLKKRGVQWYLFGAQAAIVWGSPRFSHDVDVTVTVSEAEIDDYIDAMRRHGFDPIPTDRGYVLQTRLIRFVHRGTRMPVDVVLAGPGIEDEFLRRSINVDISGTSVPVMSREDLIITKIVAGRPTDIQDVRGVIGAWRDSLDVTRIREILGLLAQALTRGDLVPEFEKVWEADL
jgi:predicted nucleotidyltransferase